MQIPFEVIFNRLKSEFPEETTALERLQVQIWLAREHGGHKEFTFDRLSELVEPVSSRVLVFILGQLCEVGILKKIIRVESPSGGGIGDYPSVLAVPDEIVDWRDGRTIQVTPDDLLLLYKILPEMKEAA